MRLNAVARSFLALYDSESNAASLRKRKCSVLSICIIYTREFLFPLGWHLWHGEQPRVLSCSCTAVERLVWLLPASLWRNKYMDVEALVQQRTEQDPFTVWQWQDYKKSWQNERPILPLAPFFCKNGNAHERDRAITFYLFFFKGTSLILHFKK